jgi:predicted MFS family arabinose efflux permease
LRESFGALRERQFRLLFTGQIVSLLGDALTSVALAFAVLDITHSASSLGYVLAAKTLPLVAFLLVGGVFADRLPRRAVMLSADVVRMGAQGVVAALVLTGSARLWELIVLQAISGTATAFFNPASTGLTPMTVSPERLQQANALRGLSMAFAGISGFALSGVLTASVGPGWALAIDSASFGVSAFYLAQLRLPPHVTLPAQSFLADLRDGWQEFASRTWVWVIVLAASLGNMATAMFSVLGAVLFKESLGGALPWALVLVSLSAGQIAGGLVALRVRVQRPLYFSSPLLFFLALVIALLAVHAPTPVLAAGALLAGAGNMIFNSLWETALQQHIPPAALSRVSAYDWFGSMAFQPLGLAIAGPLAVAAGIDNTLWIATALVAGSTAAILATPSVRRLESVRQVQEPQLEQIA